MLEQNSNNLKRIPNEAKQTIHAMYMHDSEYVMDCTTAFTSIPNTFNKLLLQSDFHSSYTQSKYNGK